MKKVVTIVFAWLASLVLIGLSVFIGWQYHNRSTAAAQTLVARLKDMAEVQFERAISDNTQRLSPAESQVIMNSFMDANPKVLSLTLQGPSGETSLPLVKISLLGDDPEAARGQIDPLGVFYRDVTFSFYKNREFYVLEAYAPVVSEEDYMLFLRISGITLSALLAFIFILLIIPNRKDRDPQFRRDQSAWDTESSEPEELSEFDTNPNKQSRQYETSSSSPRTAADQPSPKWKSQEAQDKLYAPSGLSHTWFMIPRMDNELSRAGSFSLDLSVVVFDSIELRDMDMRLRVAQEVIDFFTYKDMCFEGMGNRIWVMIPSQRLEIALRTVEEFLAQLSSASLPSLYAGVASRSGRLMSGERLAEEAEKALEKASGSMDRVVGFKADPDRYRNFLAGKN